MKTIISLKRINNKLYYAKTSTLTSEKIIENLEFKPVSIQELKEEKKKLEAIQAAI